MPADNVPKTFGASDMPSTYAHYRFGKDVLGRLGGDIGKVAEDHRGIYDIGLHGPDILFYHDALHRNPVSQRGFDMHDRPGREFFGPARDTLAGLDDRDSGRAYLFGFVCHFALDSGCHPYIEEAINETGLAHTKIEGEFDRMLLEIDGKDPVRQDLSAHIRPTDADCAVISRFLGVTPDEVSRSLSDMRKYNELLLCPGKLKRRLVERKLRQTGNYDDMIGLVLNLEGDPRCDGTNSELMGLYDECVGLAVDLIQGLDAYLSGNGDLPQRFDRTFGAE